MSTGRRGQRLQPQKQPADRELELQKHGRSVEGEAVASQQKGRNYLGGDTFLCLLASLKRCYSQAGQSPRPRELPSGRRKPVYFKLC